MAQVKTMKEHVKVAASYSVPSLGVAGAVAMLIEYFMKVPTEIAVAVVVVLGFAINIVMVLIRERK